MRQRSVLAWFPSPAAAAVLAALALASAIAIAPRRADAHQSSGRPLIGQLRLAVDFSPGICAPGAVLFGCAASAREVTFRALSLHCIATGAFEGRELAATPCALHARGYLHPLVTGLTRPDCATGRVEAHGYASIGGERRTVKLASVVRADGHQIQSGWMDDADPDGDPVGDHTVLVDAQAVDGKPFEPGAIFCATSPLTHVEFESVVVID